jgi:hypothetical protein
VSGGPEHSVKWMMSHQCGRGDGGVETVDSARTSPVGTAGPLKVRGTIVFSRGMALTFPRPLIGGPGTGLSATDRWAIILNFSNTQITAEIEISLGKYLRDEKNSQKIVEKECVIWNNFCNCNFL